MKEEEEIVLGGGTTAASVVRIGDSVHRTPGPNHLFVRAILRELEARNFAGAPRFLGADERGREVFSFVAGTVPRDVTLTLAQQRSAAKLLRSLHDALAGSVCCGTEETVCHHDFAPWNIILDEGEVAGVIDFDDAAPGARIDDLAYFIWTFLDLGVASASNEVQLARIGSLIRAYGPLNIDDLIPAFGRQQQRILAFRERSVREENDPETRAFSARAVRNIKQSMEWVRTHGERIMAATRMPSQPK